MAPRRALRNFLRPLRDRRDLTLLDVSKRAGFSEAYYGLIERGRRLPSEDAVRRLSDVFDLEPAEREHFSQLVRRLKWESRGEQLGLKPVRADVVPIEPPDVLEAKEAIERLHDAPPWVWRQVLEQLRNLEGVWRHITRTPPREPGERAGKLARALRSQDTNGTMWLSRSRKT